MYICIALILMERVQKHQRFPKLKFLFARTFANSTREAALLFDLCDTFILKQQILRFEGGVGPTKR